MDTGDWVAAGLGGVGLLLSAIGVVAAVRAVNRRRLVYGVTAVTPLLTGPAGVRRGLEVRHGGEVVDEPHVLRLGILCRGRPAIRREDYDDGQPMRFDVGARIVNIVDRRSTPSHLDPPAVAVDPADPCVLTVGPGLLNSGQLVRYGLLVDGRPRLVGQPRLPVADLTCRPAQAGRGRSLRRWLLVAVACSTAVFAFALLVSYLVGDLIYPVGPAGIAAVGTAVAATLVDRWRARFRIDADLDWS